MKFSIVEVISLVALIQTLLLAIAFLVFYNDKKRSNMLLSFLLFVFMILIFSSLILTRTESVQFMKAVIIGNQFALLMGPLIYLYICSVFKNESHLKWRDSFHFIPFVSVVLYLISRLYIHNNFLSWQSTVRIFGSGVFLLQSLVYIILSCRIFIQFRTNKNHSSNRLHLSRFHHFKFLLLGFIAVWLINMHTFIVLDLWKRSGLCPYMYSIYFLVLFIFINILFLLALRYPTLFSAVIRYKNSTLTDMKKSQYCATVLSYFENVEPYRDPSFCIRDLSNHVGISTCYLSQTINESFNQNFRDFINTYRIQESQKLLLGQSGGKANILEIAYQVGFNSKSAFNKAFKENTGMTPREYRNYHLTNSH